MAGLSVPNDGTAHGSCRKRGDSPYVTAGAGGVLQAPAASAPIGYAACRFWCGTLPAATADGEPPMAGHGTEWGGAA